MQVTINDRHNLLSQMAADRAVARVRAAFAKFGQHVKTVLITVEDINGPKGGNDKECRVLVTVKKLNDVVVTANNQTISKALPGAIDRAARSVGRQLAKRKQGTKAATRVGV